jgi:hypothetical protein
MAEVTRRHTQGERRAESEQSLLAATAQLIVERGFSPPALKPLRVLIALSLS